MNIAAKYTFEDGPYGGNGGSAWSDGTSVYLNGEITKIDIWSGARVDGIRAQYGTTWSANHGGSGGSLHNIDLKFGETIISVTGKQKNA